MRRGTLLLVATLLGGGAPGLAAQQPPPESYALRVDVQLVTVDVAVTDEEGHFLPGLRGENFRILENGAPQQVAHFLPTRAPVRIALLVEASPAVYLIRGEQLTAAYHLLAGLRAEDEVALLTYAREAGLEVPFTRDKQRVGQRLRSLGQFGLGMAEMNLLDAVAQTLAWMSPPPQRTAVVVIGTGLDTGSRVPWELLQRRVGAGQITFFAVATGHLLRAPEKGNRSRTETDNDLYFRSAFARADALLRALAAASAGQAYFPESAEELEDIYREIAARLRNLYSLGYYPSNRARDGRYREITVELVDEQGEPLVLRDASGQPINYRLFARPGYFAPSK